MPEHHICQSTIDQLEEAAIHLTQGFTNLTQTYNAFSQVLSDLNGKLDSILHCLDALTPTPSPPTLPPPDAPMPNMLPMLTLLPCPAPRQQSPTPILTLLPMVGKGDGPAIRIDSSTTYFPVKVWQHHRVDIIATDWRN